MPNLPPKGLEGPTGMTFISEQGHPVRTYLYVDLREIPRRYFIVSGGITTQFWNPETVPKETLEDMLEYEKDFKHELQLEHLRAHLERNGQELRKTRKELELAQANLAQYTTAEKLRKAGVEPAKMGEPK